MITKVIDKHFIVFIWKVRTTFVLGCTRLLQLQTALINARDACARLSNPWIDAEVLARAKCEVFELFW